MRWILAVLSVIATVSLFLPLHYNRWGNLSRFWMLVFKVVPTAICAAFAGAAMLTGGGLYAFLIFIGICICCAGDWLLRGHFITGGVMFLTGHLFYISAFCVQQMPTLWSIPVFAVMLGLLWLFLQQFRKKMGKKMFALVRIYTTVLAVLLALSLPLPFAAFSIRTLFAALGAVIFVLSDMGVCHGMLCKISHRRRVTYLGIYYLAQLLLALSAY